MRVLHLNTNYTYSALHQLMIEALEQTGNIDSHVFMSTFNKNLGVVTPRKNVCVCECVRKRDRLSSSTNSARSGRRWRKTSRLQALI